MASQKAADRRIIHCLICQKPQDSLSTHLGRTCMKKSTPEERLAELQRAKDSAKEWTREARNWDYRDMCRRYPHRPSRMALLEDLLRRNFFVANVPKPGDPEPCSESENGLSSDSGTAGKKTSSMKAKARDPTLQKSLKDCQYLMVVAKPEMLTLYDKLLHKKYVDSDEKTLFRYFCEAILILECFLKPGAVMGMTASEWLSKKEVEGKVCVSLSVTQLKTATTQNITFALDKDQAEMLEAYFSWIRPECVDQKVADEGRFFLSTCGRPVISVCGDISRLHTHFNLPKVTITDVQKVLEMEMAAKFTEEQRAAVAQYMAGSTTMANVPYSTLKEAVAISSLLGTLAGSSSDDLPGKGTSQGEKRSREEAEEADFAAFLVSFPISLNGQVPTKKQRVDAGFPADRVFYDKWRALQYGLREKHLLSKCSSKPPTTKKVEKLIERKGWTVNYPHPEDIVAKWRPATQTQLESDPAIIEMVSSQKWSGVAITDCGNDGQGVVATRQFAEGSIICDYHGKVITKAEGQRMMESIDRQMGYLFFFKELCIAGQTFPCKCHPDMDTVGRRMNHSKENFNAKPRRCRLKFPEGERDVILFLAARDIQVGEEIRFDSGNCRKS